MEEDREGPDATNEYNGTTPSTNTPESVVNHTEVVMGENASAGTTRNVNATTIPRTNHCQEDNERSTPNHPGSTLPAALEEGNSQPQQLPAASATRTQQDAPFTRSTVERTKVTRDAALTMALTESTVRAKADHPHVDLPAVVANHTTDNAVLPSHRRPGAEWINGMGNSEDDDSMNNVDNNNTNDIEAADRGCFVTTATLVQSTTINEEEIRERLRQELLEQTVLAREVTAVLEEDNNSQHARLEGKNDNDDSTGQWRQSKTCRRWSLALVIVVVAVTTVVAVILTGQNINNDKNINGDTSNADTNASVCDAWLQTQNEELILATDGSSRVVRYSDDPLFYVAEDALTNASNCNSTDVIQGPSKLYQVTGTGNEIVISACSASVAPRFTLLQGALKVSSGLSCQVTRCIPLQEPSAHTNTTTSIEDCPVGTSRTTVAFDSSYGEDYYLAISGFTPSENEIDDTLVLAVHAKNDRCDLAQGPILLVDSDFREVGKTHDGVLYASSEPSNISCWPELSQEKVFLPQSQSSIYGRGSAWYKFIGNGQKVTATGVCKDNHRNHSLSLTILGGSCGSPVCVADNELSCDLATSVSWTANLDQEYWILVRAHSDAYSYDEKVASNDSFVVKQNVTMRFWLTLATAITPSNSQCFSAVSIPNPQEWNATEESIEGRPVTIQGSTVQGVTQDASLERCGNLPIYGPGAWYKIEGTGRPLRASTCQQDYERPNSTQSFIVPLSLSAHLYTTKISVYEGGCDVGNGVSSLRCVGGAVMDFCESRPWSLGSATWKSIENRTYYILVHSLVDTDPRFNDTAAEGHFVLSVDHADPPAAACELEVDIKCTGGCNVGAQPTCVEEPSMVQFQYVGGDCGNFRNSFCQDYNGGPPNSDLLGILLDGLGLDDNEEAPATNGTAYIVVQDQHNATEQYFSGWVELQGVFAAQNMSGRFLNISIFSTFNVTTNTPETILQTVVYDLDCDFGMDYTRLGSIRLVSFTDSVQGAVLITEGFPAFNFYMAQFDIALQAPFSPFSEGELTVSAVDVEVILGDLGYFETLVFFFNETQNATIIPGDRPVRDSFETATDYFHPFILTFIGNGCQSQVFFML